MGRHMITTDVIKPVSFSGSRPKPPYQARSLIKSSAHRITCTYCLIAFCWSTRKTISMPLFVKLPSLLRAVFLKDFMVLLFSGKYVRYSLTKGKFENAHFSYQKQSNYFLILLLHVVTLLSEYRREI
jgi:hypothetical protein